MANQKTKSIAVILIGAVLIGGGLCSLTAQTSTATVSEQQNMCIYLPTIVTLLIIGLPTPLQGPDTSDIKPPASEIVIIRLSDGD